MGNSISSVQPTSSIHHYGTIDKQEKSTIRFNIVNDTQKDGIKHDVDERTQNVCDDRRSSNGSSSQRSVVKDTKTNDSYHSL